MSVFFYTFRTNKFTQDIESILGQEVYVIDRYAKDFDKLVDVIDLSGNESVCGIGISLKGRSRFEKKAFNKIGKNKISLSGPEEVILSTPRESLINWSSGMTFGPCNYVAYRLAIAKIKKSNYFIHIRPDSFEDLKRVVW